jgi:hypothetical protein
MDRGGHRGILGEGRSQDRPERMSPPFAEHEKGGGLVEVRIGIQNSGRELTFESAESPAAVQKTIGDAIEKQATHFTLTDENGRLYLVPTATLAYVEVGSERTRRVGFVA